MMLFQKTIAGLVLVTSLFAIGCGSKTETPLVPDSPGIDEPKDVPADFKIVADYSAGYSSWKSWNYTINADGSVVQKTLPSRGSAENSTKQTKLTKDDIEVVWSKVREAHFFKLKKEYKANITDQPTLNLEITRNKETHRVSVYGYQDITQKDEQNEVKRFLGIWSEVVKLVPPPNPDQKWSMYKLGN